MNVKALLFVAALVMPASANNPPKIFVDGEQIGTVALIEYYVGEVRITTNETVYGCKQDIIFNDKFQELEL